MKKMVRLVALFIAVTLAGCTSMKYNGSPVSSKSFSKPPIGSVTTAFIGESMLSQGRIVEQNVLKVHQLIDGIAYNIPPNTYPQVGYDGKNDFYSAVGVTKNPFADPFTGLSLGKAPGSQLCVITVFGAKTCYEGSYTRKREPSVSDDSHQQTLLYSGRVGNKINISYREFSNNMARPAFNNEVEYDLNDSNIIGYKGARIEVLKADNSSITYRVINNFR
ncbi:hypothetical protein [Neptuniibacter sp.]|uniref:hypothetical protein n=1 Tax=Neptuniibacter sp. TaxID=1962643 RepID=UPI003B5C2D69